MASRTPRAMLFPLTLALLVVGIASLINPSTAAESQRSHGGRESKGPLTGTELADSIGLVLLPEKPIECMDYVEVDDPAGYCIETVVDYPGSRDSRELGLLLRGYIPSELDLDIFDLRAQLAETASDDPRAVELYAQLFDLLEQQRAAAG